MSNSLDMLLKRVEELESQAAFQDELHESLNAVVAKQDSEILRLKRHMRLLSERLTEMGEVAPGTQAQEGVPPHY